MNMKDVMSGKGSYAALRYDWKSVNALADYCIANNVPKSRCTIDRIHTTVLYSQKWLPNLRPTRAVDTISAQVSHLEIWDTRSNSIKKEITRALILVLDAPEIVQLHQRLMKEHQAEYDHPNFIPHITLSYDIGNMTLKQFSPMPPLTLTVTSLYTEELIT